MICNRGDVVVVPFPFVERPVLKLRPVLVLSGRMFNSSNAHTILAMITTGAGSSWPDDHDLEDIASAGLSHKSMVRWKVFTLPNEMMRRTIGRLGDADRSHIDNVCEQVFAK